MIIIIRRIENNGGAEAAGTCFLISLAEITPRPRTLSEDPREKLQIEFEIQKKM
jgi:hypothetical protein